MDPNNPRHKPVPSPGNRKDLIRTGEQIDVSMDASAIGMKQMVFLTRQAWVRLLGDFHYCNVLNALEALTDAYPTWQQDKYFLKIHFLMVRKGMVNKDTLLAVRNCLDAGDKRPCVVLIDPDTE